MDLWRRKEAESPLLIDVPHAGTHVPPDILERLTPIAGAVPDTDWHVDKLFAFAERLGAGLLAATHSRYVIDLNRGPDGAALYPGADNTELVPLTSFEHQPLYLAGREPGAEEVEARIDRFWRPYHRQLAQDIEAVKRRFGYCILLDAHSIPRAVPRFFDGHLPDLNLGTAMESSAAPAFVEAAWRSLDAQNRFTRVHNGRFTGGYITRHYGKPESGVHALQIEIVQNAYMEEATPERFDEARAAALIGVMRDMVLALLAIRP